MLLEVHARNFLLFREVHVTFQEGFNVITGETGAGKSMFVRLLRSFSGDFKAREMIGPFEEGFWIESLWKPDAEMQRKLLQMGFPADDPTVIRLSGTAERFTARLNGLVISGSALSEWLRGVVEVHSQNAFQQLRNPAYQTRLIDLVAQELPGSPQQTFAEYRRLHAEYLELKQLQQELPGNTSEVLRTLDFLDFQVQEIESARLQPNEDTALLSELSVLSNFETLKNNLGQVLSLLEDNVEYPPVVQAVSDVLARLEQVRQIDANAGDWCTLVEGALEALSDVSRSLFDYLDHLEYDEERLRELEARINLLETLKRKYGPTLDDVLRNLVSFRQQRDTLQGKLQRVQTLDSDMERLQQELGRLDEQIAQFRDQAATIVEKRVEQQLKDLKMGSVSLGHQVIREPDFTPHGHQLLEFTASTNPGMPQLSMARIASGGELSRLFLALELSLRDQLPVRTIVFDEIDSGVGPRLGDLIGQKIRQMSESGLQVFVVTHLPQVAALGQWHLKVGKNQQSDSTESQLFPVSGEERLQELKEMQGSPPEELKPK